MIPVIPDPGPLLAHAAMLLLVGIVVLAASERQGVFQQAATALGLHLVIGGVLYGVSGLWAPDAMHYDRLGMAFQKYWFDGGLHEPLVTSGKEGLPSMLAVVYHLLGHHPFLGILLNIGMASLVVPVVASTSRLMSIDPQLPAWLAAGLPPMLLWGSLLLRESAAWLMLALIVRGLAGLAEGSHPVRNWLLVVLPLGPLVTVRGTAAVLVGAASLMAFALTARNKVMPVLVGVIGLIVSGPAVASLVNEIAGGYDVATINQQRTALARNSASSFDVETYDSLGGMLATMPLALLRGVAGPFPWELPSLGVFLIMDTLVWWLLVVAVIVGIRHIPDRRLVLAALIPALVLLVVLSITSGNYGTMTRLRSQIGVMLLPVAGLGMSLLWARLLSQTRDLRATPAYEALRSTP